MGQKAKVIHLSTIAMTASKLLRPQCEYFKKLGYEVGFVFSPDREVKASLQRAGFEVSEIFINRKISWTDIISILQLMVYFRRTKPDIVHTHTSKSGIVGRVAARLAGVPYVFHTVHGFPFIEGQNKAKYNFYVTIERWAARFTDVLLSQSLEDVEAAKCLGIRGREGYPIHIGNGINIRRFNPLCFEGQKEQIRQELGIGDVPVITIIGRQTFEKGYAELVHALAQISELDWTALFVGKDEGAGQWIKDALAKHGIAERVYILGERSDVDRLLSVSDIYVLPSYREGVPRSVIEAQAMKIPAVVTNIRGCREVVQDGVTGYLVPPRDSAALAFALHRLLTDPERRTEMGMTARRRVEIEFNENKVFKRVTQAYEATAHCARFSGN
ncbi:MAG: glycosyltransferase family 4 protein [Firmicutes bacterium]|nr:glycosyltransferase family 4 protein [Bacillota bacterium]